MKKLFVGIFVVLGLVAFTSLSAQTPIKWTQFESKEGNFKVNFLTEPEKSGLLIGNRNFYWFQNLTNQYFLAVSYTDLELKNDKTDNKEKYNYFENQIIEVFKKKIKSKYDLNHKELEGRELILEEQGERSVIRIFIVGKRVYYNVVIMRIADFESPKMSSMASAFFDSFSIITTKK